MCKFQGPSDGFAGEPSKLGEFTAVTSGPFNATSTWSERIIPYGNCSIVISQNTRVTVERSAITLDVKVWYIYGSLVLGSRAADSFTFTNAPNIIVYRGGDLTDNTGRNIIIAPPGTIWTFYPGGSFTGNNTNVTTPSTSRSLFGSSNTRSIGSQVTGPYTLGVLPGNEIQTFTKVTSIVTVSGGFSTGSTWLGGIAPSADVCIFVGGCGMSISSSFALSTASLNGVMNINFDQITVGVSARLQLGTPGSSAGFRFRYSLTLACYGTLQDATGGSGGIFLPKGSNFNFYAGAQFVSAVATTLFIYDPATGATIGVGLSLSVSFSGPFFISVSVSGFISTSITGKRKCFFSISCDWFYFMTFF